MQKIYATYKQHKKKDIAENSRVVQRNLKLYIYNYTGLGNETGKK